MDSQAGWYSRIMIKISIYFRMSVSRLLLIKYHMYRQSSSDHTNETCTEVAHNGTMQEKKWFYIWVQLRPMTGQKANEMVARCVYKHMKQDQYNGETGIHKNVMSRNARS